MSFRRRPESIPRSCHSRKVDRSSQPTCPAISGWIPAFAGMTSGLRKNDALIHLIPLPKSSCILPPSPRMGGLQANSGGVSRVGALPLPQVRVRAEACARLARAVPKTGTPGRPASQFLIYSGAFAVSGSTRLPLGNAESLPSLACDIHDNRVTGGALACPLAASVMARRRMEAHDCMMLGISV